MTVLTQTIHHLPDYIISQIAAGEVIERPAYVVKELIDNAIDAQANTISIDVVDGGISHIVVTDNGIGMSREDLIESCNIHTTSKIHTVDDLTHITTLGFRGEALASIASVSSLTIETKQQASLAGYKLILQNNTPTITSVGMPTGTRVLVSQLFSHIPARKKFLKNKRSEMKKIIDIVTSYALCHPTLSFLLSNEGKSILHLQRTNSLKQRIQDLYGQTVYSHLLPVSINDSYINMEGFIATPQLISNSISEQHISINGRPITDRLIQSAIKEGYGVLLPSDTQPTYILSFSILPEMVDTNIHPRKEHVRIINESFLGTTLRDTVQQTLSKQHIHYEGFPLSIHDSYDGLTYTPLSRELKNVVLPKKTEQLGFVLKESHVLQLHNLYIIAQTENGITLIDQHAAHERILYEQFAQELIIQQKKKKIVVLNSPIILDFSPQEQLLIETYLNELILLGFDIESFSGQSYKISSVPELFHTRNIASLIRELVQDMADDTRLITTDTGTKKLLAYLACRSAVKAGDPLTQEQMHMIIHELENIPHAVTCPHGRPLQFLISLGELHHMFKRR